MGGSVPAGDLVSQFPSQACLRDVVSSHVGWVGAGVGQAPVFAAPKDSLDSDCCFVQSLAPPHLQQGVLVILGTGVMPSCSCPPPHSHSACLGQGLVSISQCLSDISQEAKLDKRPLT